ANNSRATISSTTQQSLTDRIRTDGRWFLSKATVADGSLDGTTTNTGACSTTSRSNCAVVTAADSSALATGNTNVLNNLSVDVRGTWRGPGTAPNSLPPPLLPTGNDDANTFDTPIKVMLDDARAEAARLITADTLATVRNTVVIMVVGGGEGNTTSG